MLDAGRIGELLILGQQCLARASAGRVRVGGQFPNRLGVDQKMEAKLGGALNDLYCEWGVALQVRRTGRLKRDQYVGVEEEALHRSGGRPSPGYSLPEPDSSMHTSVLSPERSHRRFGPPRGRSTRRGGAGSTHPSWVREEPDVVPSRPPRLLPVAEDAERQLKRRTLTNLYTARPAWLANLHRDLDAAVFAAYGWPEAKAPDALWGRTRCSGGYSR